MDLRALDTVLRIWVVGSLVVGAGFIILGNPALTTIGVLLIIVGLMSLMPVVRNFLVATDVDADADADRSV